MIFTITAIAVFCLILGIYMLATGKKAQMRQTVLGPRSDRQPKKIPFSRRMQAIREKSRQRSVKRQQKRQNQQSGFELRHILIALALFGWGWVIIGGPVMGVLAALGGLIVIRQVQSGSDDTSQSTLRDQLEESLFRAANVLRSGGGLLQMLEELAEDRTPQPLRGYMQDALHAVQAANITPIEALKRLSEQLPEFDELRQLTIALETAHEQGADMADITMMFAQNIRAHRIQQRQLRAATAQSRYTGVVMLILGIGVTTLFRLLGIISGTQSFLAPDTWATRIVTLVLYAMMGFGYIVVSRMSRVR